jgi:hypothetical protein
MYKIHLGFFRKKIIQYGRPMLKRNDTLCNIDNAIRNSKQTNILITRVDTESSKRARLRLGNAQCLKLAYIGIYISRTKEVYSGSFGRSNRKRYKKPALKISYCNKVTTMCRCIAAKA